MSAIEAYLPLAQLTAFCGGWLLVMVTGLFFGLSK